MSERFHNVSAGSDAHVAIFGSYVRDGSSLLEASELWHLHDRIRDDLGTLFSQPVLGETVSIRHSECDTRLLHTANFGMCMGYWELIT